MSLTSKYRILFVDTPPAQSDYQHYNLSIFISLSQLYNTRKLAEDAIRQLRFPGKFIIVQEYLMQ
jgi:hypothetical protein